MIDVVLIGVLIFAPPILALFALGYHVWETRQKERYNALVRDMHRAFGE